MKQLRVLLGSARGTDVYHRFYVSSKKDRCKSVKLEVGAGARGHFNWNQLKQLASIERAADSASLRPQRDFMWSAYARSHDSLSVLVFFFNYCHACGYMTGASFQGGTVYPYIQYTLCTVGPKRPSSLPTNQPICEAICSVQYYFNFPTQRMIGKSCRYGWYRIIMFYTAIDHSRCLLLDYLWQHKDWNQQTT